MTENAAAPAPAEKANLFDDFVDIFASPGKVFARRTAASPALPFLIVCGLLILMFYVNRGVMASIMDGEIARSMDAAFKSNPQITADQQASAKALGQKMASISLVVGAPVALLCLGLVTWIVGRIFGGALSYGTALMIASFSWIPRVVESLAGSVQGLLLDTSKMTSRSELQLGAARFLDPAATPLGLMHLAERVDLFTLWVTIMLVIGLMSAAKMPKNRMIPAGLTLFVVGSIPALWEILRS